jgi:glycosyltransferase involved in cell wall biosynthesis
VIRIALDFTVAARPGGIAVYAAELLAALGRRPRDHEITLWCGTRAAATLARATAPAGVRVVPPGRLGPALDVLGRLAPFSLLSVDGLVGPVDLFHGLNCLLPAQRGRATPVITVFDLSALHHPEWHPRHRALMHRLALPRAVRLAAWVITPTEAMRHEVIDVLRIAPEKVRAIPLGVSDRFRPIEAARLGSALARYGLSPHEYICFVGAIEPRKNIRRLVEAMTLVRARRPDAPPLILAGPQGWGEDGLRGRLEGHNIRYLGYLEPREAVAVIAGALLLVYPSLYEGFGLPVLEALACGTPVLASADPAIKEVAGDAAAYVNPEDVEAIASGIVDLLDTESRRAELSRRGVARARQFSWDRTAAATLALYASCVRAG